MTYRYWRNFDRVKLGHAVVYRGGARSSIWSYTRDSAVCRAMVGEDADGEEAIGIHFSIPSKGGGRTGILVRLGPEDLMALLQLVATSWESSDAVVLDAVKALLEAREDEGRPGSE